MITEQEIKTLYEQCITDANTFKTISRITNCENERESLAMLGTSCFAKAQVLAKVLEIKFEPKRFK